MILESKDVFDQLAELDPISGRYRFLSRKEHPELTTESFSGGYSIVNEMMVALYRTDTGLYFRVGEQTFELTDDVRSKLMREDNKQVFQLVQNGSPLLNFAYMPPVPEIPLSIDPTPFIGKEDFDFLLFVHSVLTEGGRRYRVYNQ